MSTAESESADEADADDEQFEYYPQVTQHPHTIIAGEVVDIVTGANISENVEDTGTSFGVVFESPTVPQGSIWQNSDIPEGFKTNSEYNDLLRLAAADSDDGGYIRDTEVTEENIESARERLVDAGVLEDGDEDIEISFNEQDGMKAVVDGEDVAASGTDFKVADTANADVQEVDGTVLGVDVGGGVYGSSEVDAFDSDRIMVWYGGMSGQFVGRALDFNGRPSARVKDDGYLVKGLYQHPIGWFERDVDNFDSVPSTDRAKLATDLGRPPRVARPPVLRSDVEGEEAFIEIDLYDGGPMHEVTVAFNDFEGDDWEDATTIEPRYEQDADEILASTFEGSVEDLYALYTGEGWQDAEPDWGSGGGAGGDASGASFDVGVAEDEVEHPTEAERTFGQQIAEVITGTGIDPDDSDALEIGGEKMDLEGAVGANADQFDVTPDVDAIREVVYENTSHLDTEDL